MANPRALLLGLLLSLLGCRAPLSGPWPPIVSGVQEYRIGPGDIIRISVFGNNDLSNTVTVRPDGRVTLPLVDEVIVAGRTVAEANREIAERYRRYLSAENRISVVVTEIHSYRIYVLGKVTHPGEFESRVPVTVLQALALAGGPQRTADIDRIVVLRRGDGREERYMFSYNEAIGGRSEMNFTLHTGDTVVVP